jgi:NADH:ubiquinone oxidoreductase subunit 6 (subunit J)
MSIAQKYRMIAGGLGAACFLVILALLEQYLLAVWMLSLVLVIGHRLKREPVQRRVRPSLQVLGWLLVGIAIFAMVASWVAISAVR